MPCHASFHNVCLHQGAVSYHCIMGEDICSRMNSPEARLLRPIVCLLSTEIVIWYRTTLHWRYDTISPLGFSRRQEQDFSVENHEWLWDELRLWARSSKASQGPHLSRVASQWIKSRNRVLYVLLLEIDVGRYQFLRPFFEVHVCSLSSAMPRAPELLKIDVRCRSIASKDLWTLHLRWVMCLFPDTVKHALMRANSSFKCCYVPSVSYRL